MPPRRDQNPSGLGRAIINRKVKDAKRMHETGNYSVDVDQTARLKSVTQEGDMEEFFNTAELAGTDFAAERRNMRVIQQSVVSSQNPFLLTEQEEANVVQKQEANKKRLRVPRRPPWTRDMTAAQVDKQEKAAFLDWRRGLAQLQEEDGFLLTPFERNLEVWRQLWRVIERSHLIVQIVDARNPLRFRCEDLEDYIRDVEGAEGEAVTGKSKRKSLLLINKADLLTAKQRCGWANYFESQGVRYAFFSAANAAFLQQARREALDAKGQTEGPADDNTTEELQGDDSASNPHESGDEVEDSARPPSDQEYFSAEEDDEDSKNPKTHVLSVLELENLLLQEAPPLSEFVDASGKIPTKLNVGLVGYPNVGKSSTINSLLGEKKVSVSATPGKTKHFQTIHLSESIILCDCPGLVFPQFATTKADLICDGVLPIDQMREYTAPIALLIRRIPKEVLEATYGIAIKVQGVDEGGNGQITEQNFLIAYAIARGYTRSGQGNPDEARAARYILKDYVNAKLLFCHSPPGIEESVFNEQTRQMALIRAERKKKAPVTRVGKDSDTFVAPSSTVSGGGPKTNAVDNDFFDRERLSSYPSIQGHNKTGQAFSRAKFYPHQHVLTDDGTPLNFRSARIASILENAGVRSPTGGVIVSCHRLGKYIVTSQCLGTGSFATVHLALDPKRHRQVACKSIRTRKESEVEQVMKEVKILMKLKHPNINEIYDTEQDKRFLNIFLQLCTGGDLFTYITGPMGTGNPLCEAEAKFIMYQLLEGLSYLHDLMISHRADFGLARPNAYQETFNVCGTVSYLPPEGVLALDHKHLGYIGMPADCWSAGVILYVMLAGCHPFDNEPAPQDSGDSSTHSNLSTGSRDTRLKERIVYGGINFPFHPWNDLGNAKKLILELLIHDHLRRATVNTALNSEWIKSDIQQLKVSYRRRITDST
ncbi:hypothetical protein AGABI2DRAFT_182004 [Agaricus bisporus var. bisporus H97]|uniref:hypothetical protein n=1 Tax=Agaricus bisporus var. bisporus (strain H97 / ATCC MYA-4626 / FGSC 10389) TaxID=936046 RepID=UPI00029F5ECF|nr:hypothetical protein AGABI2DRAFT_182004 [Agaricus bisporus var. bisporus H97]EKV51020.1 hypothetical protein AGABI2DRAFT_182004 [Agaricus bisporus var. bisporus H97]